MSLPVLTLREWDQGSAPVDTLSGSDRRLAESLRVVDGGRVLIDERRDGVMVTSRSWVGVVRFSEWELRVVPKLAGGNLGVARMLDYASGIDMLKTYESSRELEAVGDSLLELIAWLFAGSCARLVTDGLLSDYVGREDTLHVLRGRLRTREQVTRRFGLVDPLDVAFDEFETDIPENQTIACALEATRSVVRTSWLQRRIRRMHSVFHEAAPSGSADPLLALDEMAYSRRNEHYRGAHELARLLLRRIAVKDLLSPGGTSCFAFLLDMNVLFEAFVSRLVADALEPLGVRVHSQRRDPSIIFDEGAGKRYSAIIPDLLLERRRGALVVRLPVDAKYKLYDQRAIDPADVYQTFFYAFAYAADEAASRPARAVILYPRNIDGGDISLRVDTHAGRMSARLSAFGVNVESALESVRRGRPSVGSVPALGRLYGVYREVSNAAAVEAGWLAS